MIQELAGKFTLKDGSAMDITQLLDSLQSINFTTPEARKFKAAIGKMAEVLE